MAGLSLALFSYDIFRLARRKQVSSIPYLLAFIALGVAIIYMVYYEAITLWGDLIATQVWRYVIMEAVALAGVALVFWAIRSILSMRQDPPPPEPPKEEKDLSYFR